LREILDEYLPVRQKVDFMNVDVEGKDLEVLESNDWVKYRPTLVVVEDNAPKPEASAIVAKMDSWGYGVCVQNVIVLGKVIEYFFIDRNSELFLSAQS
jgi:hypothetical protein